ncbi:MAG TPA: PAS domain S-box protein, partial [Puia sp.]|nr:PAS domain S-box protein [Puia sp.]
MGRILACLVLSAAMLRISGALGLIHLNIDHLLFTEKLAADAANNMSSQMTVSTASCLILSAAALLTMDWITKGGIVPSQNLVFLVAAMGLFSVIGYVYHVQAFYGTFTYIPMAAHTSAAFLFFSAAILLARPRIGIMKELTSSHTGGVAARSLLPIVILLPVLLGYLRLLTYWQSLISTEFGVTALVVSIVFAFTIVVWYNTRLLNKRDEQRVAAERTLLESEARFRLMINSVKDYAIFMLDPSGYIVSWNESAEQIKGYKKEEILGKHMSVFYTAEEVEH